MRWLLQELVEAAADVGGTAGAAMDDLVQTAQQHSAGLMEAMTDAATSLASTASEAASGLASELGSTVASTVVAENAAAGHAIDSATAMPLAEARAGAAGAGGLISMGAQDGFVDPQPLQHALDGPHSMWHGHGRMISILVFAHLAAFLYWCAIAQGLVIIRDVGVLASERCICSWRDLSLVLPSDGGLSKILATHTGIAHVLAALCKC